MLASAARERSAIVPILQHIGVPRDGVVVVHSAIARLSRQGFRAEAIIESLLEYMRDGTVLMPTMTWRTVTPEQPLWDELETPSHTGVLSEIFRTCYAGARSIHPTHSVVAFGPQAVSLLARHHLDDTPVSRNSPYGLMCNENEAAYVMLLGVGLESCTAIHLAEETIAPNIYLRPAHETEEYDCRDRHGVVHKVRTRRHRRLDRDFPKYGAALQHKSLMHSGRIGDCPYSILRLADLLQIVFAGLHFDPRGTLRSPFSS